MALSPDTRLLRNPSIVHSEMDGDTVMMDSSLERYFGLEEVGTRIWELLAEEQSLGSLCTALTQEFDVSEDDCLRDIGPFLERLIELDLVQVH